MTDELFNRMAEPFVMLVKNRVPDNMGGFVTAWDDGATFTATIFKDGSLEAAVAEKQGVTGVYTVTTPIGTCIDYHEAFRRVSDGKVFRATTSYQDSKTPKMASFQFEQVKAESWEIPND